MQPGDFLSTADDAIAVVENIHRCMALGEKKLLEAIRAKPIVLTGVAAMIGGFFIIDDPIFNGLAISLIFGILVSTLLTLLVIPVMYYAFRYKRSTE